MPAKNFLQHVLRNVESISTQPKIEEAAVLGHFMVLRGVFLKLLQ
jgi:hypothetical protein